mmetsp:Transcript_1740/g.2461  ORF Transcript_1740/g.2461 Transcript_1740/m.2461 type:complete len:487 (+) Transcript_1740:2587-4047(+)|eukprot:CAMPEP_0184027520 /NCGR_PEP_ID=MMETSP0954-20121128/14242_1 /TAXON_ID=627963 /ORGANISM="Aplanochytrium sp, Strain PBS07" /LENGTH=486 /DNA_ID=CAMNT_0026312085 /DNA_START=2507 /DNA_END=3967 /DNA_ORIENTATION=-
MDPASAASKAEPAEEVTSNEKRDDENTNVECLKEIKELKAEGNKLYKKGIMFHGHTLGKNTMIECCAEYAKALEKLNRLESSFVSEDISLSEKKMAYDLKLSLLLNLAAAGLKLESYDSTLNCCNSVLEEIEKECLVLEEKEEEIPKETVKKKCKALFRRAKANRGLKNFEQASEDLVLCIKNEPSNREAREEYKSLRAEWKKIKEAELFRLQTEIGMKKMEIKQRRENPQPETDIEQSSSSKQEATKEDIKKEADEAAKTETKEKNDESKIVTKEWLKSCDVLDYLKNGSILENGSYAWGQSVAELHLFLRISRNAGAKDIVCEFRRSNLTVSINGESSKRLDHRALSRNITVDESIWELEGPDCLHIVLFKEPLLTKEKAGDEWWNCVFKGDPEIDIQNCNIGQDMSQLPDDAKREWEKSIWRQQQLPPEERAKIQSEYETEDRMKRQAEERIRNNEKAMSDPSKKAFYNMMREKFPDIPVEFK